MVYLLTWLMSLVTSGIIIGGLFWFKTRGQRSTVVTSAKPKRTGRRWKGHQGRLDHSPFYVCMMWTLFVAGLVMAIGGPVHPSTIESMTPLVQRALSFTLCLGTGICIFGFMSGTRYFRRDADIRDCYRMAVLATPANVSTLTVYAMGIGNTDHWNIHLFALGAGGILAVLIAHVLMAWELHREIGSLTRRVEAAIQGAMNRTRDDEVDH